MEPTEAEQIRRAFARAWGEIGGAWGVPPSMAGLQGYLLIHGGPLTEPELRRALGLSHRAASMALSECEAWGLIERAPETRRSGQRGPAAVAYRSVGDHAEWFRRIAAARKERETDPVLPILERNATLAREAAERAPADDELREVADRLRELLEFVELFNRGVGAVVRADAAAIGHIAEVLEHLDDETIDRLVHLSTEIDPRELAGTLRALAKLPAPAARRLAAVAGSPGISRLLGG